MKRKEIIEMCESHRLVVVSITRNKHWKVRVRRPDGTERNVIFPSSSSDYRMIKNKSSQLGNIASGNE